MQHNKIKYKNFKVIQKPISNKYEYNLFNAYNCTNDGSKKITEEQIEYCM